MKYICDWYLEYLCTNDHILMYLIHIWLVGHCVGPDIANILGILSVHKYDSGGLGGEVQQ
jgi:hypothetical protein